jgi:hypothetical protein
MSDFSCSASATPLTPRQPFVLLLQTSTARQPQRQDRMLVPTPVFSPICTHFAVGRVPCHVPDALSPAIGKNTPADDRLRSICHREPVDRATKVVFGT